MSARSRRDATLVVLAATFLAMLGLTAVRAEAAPDPNPPVTTGLQLWYEAESTSYADGQQALSWPDKSGFGRTLTANDAGAAPVVRRNALNGRAALEFNGSGSLMKTYGSTFTLAQPTTFFAVYRSLDPNTTSRAFVFDSRNSSVRQVLGRPGGGQIRLYANHDLDFPGVAYPFGSYQIWSGTFDGAASSLYQNGYLIGTGNAGGSGLEGLAVGALSTSGQWGYDYSHSLVAEILYYTGSLTTAQRASVTDWLNQKYAVVGPPSPPANVDAPTIAGTATDGATLTASQGTWSGAQPISYAYQWRRCAVGGGSCTDISSATSSSYAVAAADVGSTLRVTVTATNAAGNATGTSNATGTVTQSPPVNTAVPAITGTAQSGATLTASNGSWTGTQPLSYAYQWRRCDNTGASCADIAGATSQSYITTASDVGVRLRVVVTASNSAGNASATSARSSVVAAPGGQVASDPPVTTGLALWYEAETEAYNDGDAANHWTDKSGNARNLTAFDTGSAPRFQAGAVNGRAALEFDGSRSLMKTYGSTFTLSQPTTFFIVYRSLDAPAVPEAYIFDSRNSATRQLLGRSTGGRAELYANNDLLVSGISYPFSTHQIWSGTLNGSSSSLWQNGVKLTQGNAGGSALSGFTVGALSTGNQYGYNYSHSQVAEILYYAGDLTDTSRQSVTDWLNQKYAVIGPPQAPANTAAPAISGSAVDGATLTATQGTWSGSQPISYGYRWRRCDSSGASCTDISGATSSTYTVTSADVGSRLTVAVTATNSAGSAAASATPTSAVTATAPASISGPAISGTVREGSTLTSSQGTWSGTAPLSFSYRWQRCDTNGANCSFVTAASPSNTYDLVAADVGSTMRVVATASNSAGNASATSNRTAAVVASGSPAPASDPPVTTGLQMWYEAETETEAEGAQVTRWSDKGPFGRDLTAFDSSVAPIMHRDAFNGRAMIEFDGVRSMLKTYESSFQLSQPTTFFIVYKALDTAAAGKEAYVWDSRNSSQRQLLGLGPFTNTELYADIDIEAPTPYPFPKYQVWSGTLNGASSAIWRNSGLVAASPAGNSGLDGFTVGGLSTTAQYGYLYGKNQVAEIVFYTGAMSQAGRDAMTDWLNQKYAAY